MSWFEDCPLTKEDFEMIFAYLVLTINLYPDIVQAERLQEIIKKLLKWLSNA